MGVARFCEALVFLTHRFFWMLGMVFEGGGGIITVNSINFFYRTVDH